MQQKNVKGVKAKLKYIKYTIIIDIIMLIMI